MPEQSTDNTIVIRRISDNFSFGQNGDSRSKTYIIYVIEEGEGIHEINKIEYPIKPQKIHFILPGFTQNITTTKEIKGYYISFSENFFTENTEHKDILYRLPFVSDSLTTFTIQLSSESFISMMHLVWDMLEEFLRKEDGYIKILLSSLNVLLLKLDRFVHERKELRIDTYYTSFQIVARYKKLISEHAHQEHLVSFYANKLHYTTNYLNSIVKEVTGKTSNSLIHQYLISEIKRYLMHTKLSHKEIADELGFCDQSYMTKFFKKHTGERPFDWYRKLLKNTNFR